MNWNNINLVELENAIEKNIIEYKTFIDQLAANENINLDWQTLIQPLEDAKAKLDEKFNIIAHLHSVQDNAKLRLIYSNILSKISDLHADFFQNLKLHQKILQLKNSDSFSKLNVAQQKIIKNLLLDFNLAGVQLKLSEQQKYKQITKQLGDLSDQFSKNVLDASNNWHYYINRSEHSKLRGLPDHIIELAQQLAIKQDYQDGWLLNLDFPCVDAILRYAADRELRKIIYTANVTKSSDITKQFDNSEIMQAIVNLRLELAELLNFNNYSEYSLVHKMAENTKEVEQFLNELADKALPKAKQEFLKLQEFAKQQDSLKHLEPWDVAFYADKHKSYLFNLSEEELRNYFQVPIVLSGIFKLANNLFGITVQEIVAKDAWDPEVRLYQVLDCDNNLRGFFYIDLYVRSNKKSGAWMSECISRHKWLNGNLQTPIAFLVTNFVNGPLLYHEEVLTLLHEFGHVLHHILTKVDYINIAGCNGVAWDAVELPSQFMEKWGYDWQFLQDISRHKQTGEQLSKIMFDSLIGMKNYNAGMFMVRQLEFAMFDFKLHLNQTKITIKDIQKILNRVRKKVAVVPIAKFNRFQHSFLHIFAGGYAAGYYSYNWAEVLASDAFMAFKDVDHSIMGRKFLHNILEMGGSKDAMELYVAFRGKKPTIQALLEQRNLL